ncbi:malonyl-ACP O-methyltransferase BioC [Spongiibacter pelagi]|nr:malonyl-ACP O-methyltransferase BioC [Spongiibacter pelagi]
MRPYCERVAAFSATAPELVLLHGWGSDSHVWRSLLPSLRQHFHITLIDLPLDQAEAPETALLPLLPARAIYLGWSLGGMLATRIAARYPERVSALITVASNACFVASGAWPSAMPANTFEEFAALLEQNPAKTQRRFELLQLHGDPQAKAIKSVLQHLPKRQTPWSQAQLANGLAWLREWDHRAFLKEISRPGLHLFGEQDALVPVAAVEAIAEIKPAHQVSTIADCAHIPFLSQQPIFLETVIRFLKEAGVLMADAHAGKPLAQNRVFKRDVARSFSRAAQSYDGLAYLQQQVEARLLNAVNKADAGAYNSVMDLGSGTGHALPKLQRLSACQRLFAVDLAEGMLRYSRDQHEDLPNVFWLGGDAEDLPIADDSIDLVFSNFSLQWCRNLPALYSEIARVLKPGGKAFITTLGPQTLFELKAAWQQVDALVHVNRFAERAELEQAVTASGLHCDGLTENIDVLRYEKLSELTRELKGIGAHNVNDGRPAGLTGRRQLRELQDAYEQFRDEQGRLPASYQVWSLELNKPDVEA